MNVMNRILLNFPGTGSWPIKTIPRRTDKSDIENPIQIHSVVLKENYSINVKSHSQLQSHRG